MPRTKKDYMELLKRYETVIHATGNLLYDWNCRTNEVSYGGNLKKILGYSFKEMEGGLARWGELIHPEDKEHFEKTIKELLETKMPIHFEYRVRRKNGQYIHVEDSGRFLTDENGELEGMIGFVEDITDRKQHEVKLKDIEEKYISLFESSMDGIFINNMEGNFLDANDTALKMLGYQREDIQNIDYSTILDETQLEIALADMLEILDGNAESITNEYRLKKKDGGHIWVDVKSSLMYKNGEPYGILGIARDVTERRVQEEELRESEKRFRDLSELLPQTIFEIDAMGKFSYANKYGLEITGYTQEDIESGMSALELFAPEDRERVLGNIEKILSGEKTGGNEYIVLKKDGSTFPAIVYSTPIFKDDEPAGLRGVAVDITERKQAEEAFKESEEKYRQLIDNLSDTVVEVDSQGNFSYVSPQVEDMIGYKPEEIVGHSGFELIHPDDLERAMEVMEEAISSKGTMEFNYRLRNKNGHYIPISATGRVIQQGDDLRIVSVGRDISEKLAAEKALKESEEKCRRLIDNLSDAIIEADSNGNFLYVSPQAHDIFGYEPEEVIGQCAFEFMHPDDIENAVEVIGNALSTGKIKNFEYRIRHKDGHYIPLSATGRIVKENEDEKIICVIRDITEKKQAEKRLKKAKRGLETSNLRLMESNQILENLTKRANENALGAVEASRAKSEFLANMSHEIRTPMTAIMGMTDLVLDTELDEEQKQYLSMVKTSADSLLELINNILDISKIEANKLELEYIEYDLREKLEKVINIMDFKASEKGVLLTYDFDTDLPRTIFGDPLRLKQILINLIGNAIKFTDEGNVHIKVDQKNLKDDWVEVEFSVKDTGIGIPKDKTRSIFELFIQADGSVTREYGGTGLGLAISNKLVEMMNGRLWVESEEGVGSTFYFTVKLELPDDRHKRSVEVPAKNGSEHRQIEKSMKILLVEDNAINRKLVTTLLTKMGLEVSIAKNGREGVDKAATGAFDLILMDVQMPEMDGLEATNKIREAEEGDEHVPIVALTAYAMSGDRERFLAAGMDEYISKPINPDSLITVLEKFSRHSGPQPGKALSKAEDFKEPNLIDILSVKRRYEESDEFLKELFELYIETSKNTLNDLKIAISNKDYERLTMSAHELKGSSANLSAYRLANLSYEFEHMGRSKRLNNTKERLDELENAYNRTVGVIQAYFNRPAREQFDKGQEG